MSMTRDDTMTLAFEAHAVATEVTTLLNDPNYRFEGGSGPQCVIRLTDLSEKCIAKGLRAVAKRLEQLARDVAARSD
jgi:hypothetical protein